MNMRGLATVLLSTLLSISASAQFHTAGTDPGRVKWSTVKTDNYRILFPRGMDSLAFIYGQSLETWHQSVSINLGYLPNQAYKKKMPVILHTGYTLSNGIVAWAPRSADLLTVADAYSPEAIPSHTMLSIHESRHIAQMQYGRSGHFAPFHYIFGEMFSGAMAGLYCGPAFFEGDAVYAETSLHPAGRGNTADFLEYYKVAFDNGDLRNWYRWRYGSQKYYTPDYYRAGYLLFAGMKDRFDVPDFAGKYFETLFSHKIWFFPVNNLSRTSSLVTGYKFTDAYAEISKYYQGQWRSEADSRSPFMPSDLVSEVPDFHTEYTGSVFASGELHSIKKGLVQTPTLDGKPFASSTSSLKYSSSTSSIIWSETIPDIRWSLKSYSDIFRRNLISGKRERLTKHQRFFNPSANSSGTRIAVTEYPEQGGSNLIVLDSEDGRIINSFSAPDSLQIVESAWIGNRIYVTAISEHGFGLYEITEQGPVCILAPRFIKIKQLWSDDDLLLFTCDQSSVNELYGYDGTFFRKITNTRYGASEFAIGNDSLYFSTLSPEGRLIHRTALDDLPVEIYEFPNDDNPLHSPEDTVKELPVSKAENYSKVKHLFKFHSWAPLYFNYNAAVDGSYDKLYQSASLGATAMFQNDLGTMYGMAGVSFNPRQGAYVNLTYSGLFPVFSARLNYSSQGFSGYVGSHVPLNFSSGGWKRAVTPRLSYSWGEVSNVEAAVRAYSVLPIAPSGIYPRWGIGAEIGYNSSIKQIYQYIYAYVPALSRQHGLKLTARVSRQDVEDNTLFSAFTADYAMAILPLDWSGLGPVAYLRNFELTIHAEAGKRQNTAFAGYGGSFVARLGNFLWIPYDTRIGVSVIYNSLVKETVSLVLNIAL